jgi:hypothetical protein
MEVVMRRDLLMNTLVLLLTIKTKKMMSLVEKLFLSSSRTGKK